MSDPVRYINDLRGNEAPRPAFGERPANVRSIADTVNEVREEAFRFAETRLAMLHSEMKEKLAAYRAKAPAFVIGGLFAVTAFLTLTAALVGVIATLFAGTVYAIFLASLIVTAVYAVVGYVALLSAFKGISGQGIMPERTIDVLKGDKRWLENETRIHS